jgi:hypothetical protein
MRLLFFAFHFICVPFVHVQDTIQLKKYVSNLKKVDVVIAGETYNFLFDTGGGETFLSPDIAKHLERTVYGQASSFRMNGERVDYQKPIQ